MSYNTGMLNVFNIPVLSDWELHRQQCLYRKERERDGANNQIRRALVRMRLKDEEERERERKRERGRERITTKTTKKAKELRKNGN